MPVEKSLKRIATADYTIKRKNETSDFDQKSDEAIWIEFKKGSEAAFLFIYNKYFDTLFKFAFQFSKDQDFIKDCIQDLFVELNLSSVKQVRSIKPYLMVSLKRKILYYQKRASKFIYKNDLLSGYDFQISYSQEDKMIDQQLEDEQKIKMSNAINSVLTSRQREVIYYLYYEKLSVDEIAEIMHLSHRGVQNLSYKAVAILKSHFDLIIIFLFHYIFNF
ncbi:MAG: RNA polymerase sigma factor [Cyclobacteriaceae bacterium]